MGGCCRTCGIYSLHACSCRLLQDALLTPLLDDAAPLPQSDHRHIAALSQPVQR